MWIQTQTQMSRSYQVNWFGLVWFGLQRFSSVCLVLFGSVWFCLVWFGQVLFGFVRFGSVLFGLVESGSVQFGFVRFCSVWFGLVRFGLVWFGLERFSSVSLILFGLLWFFNDSKARNVQVTYEEKPQNVIDQFQKTNEGYSIPI